jgi:hypothetical protein
LLRYHAQREGRRGEERTCYSLSNGYIYIYMYIEQQQQLLLYKSWSTTHNPLPPPIFSLGREKREPERK